VALVARTFSTSLVDVLALDLDELDRWAAIARDVTEASHGRRT
jgi:hypothetical protein